MLSNDHSSGNSEDTVSFVLTDCWRICYSESLFMKIPMKLLFLSFLCASHVMHAGSAVDNSDLQVILKLDDMQHRGRGVPVKWQRVYDYAVEQSLPISVGIICNSLDGDYPVYFETLKAWHAGGQVEFWNHGYDHKMWKVDEKKVYEFSASGYEHQYQHFADSQRLGLEKLGLVFTTFGAPFNATDADTLKVFEAFPEITVWLFGSKTETAVKTVLPRNRALNLEVRGTVEFDSFQAAFLANQVDSPLTLQGHPMGWDDEEFASFIRIVELLKEHGATFVLPRDCVAK